MVSEPAVEHDDIARAMRAIPRRDFLPRSQRPFAGQDQPLPIGRGQTSSQPATVAAMLRLLRVPLGARVLDVGAGSGWTTALLAYLTGPQGWVLGIGLHRGTFRTGTGVPPSLVSLRGPAARPPEGDVGPAAPRGRSPHA